jgi:hypothetical protein
MTNHECFEFVKEQAPGAILQMTEKIKAGLSAETISDCLNKNIPTEFRQVLSGAIFHIQAITDEA